MTRSGDAVAGADLRGNDTSAPVSDSDHTASVATAGVLSGHHPPWGGLLRDSPLRPSSWRGGALSASEWQR